MWLALRIGLCYKLSRIIKKWKCAGGQITGLGHEKFNIPGQDRIAIKENGLIKCIALADGAGSRKKSQIGAEIITKSICEISSVKFTTFYKYSKKTERMQMR